MVEEDQQHRITNDGPLPLCQRIASTPGSLKQPIPCDSDLDPADKSLVFPPLYPVFIRSLFAGWHLSCGRHL